MKTTAGAPALVVLAAGMGSRYGGLKQAAPVNAAGDAIVDFSTYDAVRAGFGKVVFVIRRDIEDAFRTGVSDRIARHVDVDYAFQQLDTLPPWGTLHATLVGAEKIQGPFAVINADDFYGAEGYNVLARHLRSDPANCAMVGFTLRNTLSPFGPVSRGVCAVAPDGHLLSTVERTSIVGDGRGARSLESDGDGVRMSGDEIVSMNMWGLVPAIVEPLQQNFRDFLQACGSDLKAESYLPKAMNHILANGGMRVDVLQTSDAWFGMTYPQDHVHVVESIRLLTAEGRYPERLWT